MTTQFRKQSSNATNRNYLSVSAIASLLKWGLPLAIGFAIALLIINPPQTGAVRPWSHIGEEALKCSPARIDSDASTPIVSVPDVVGIATSLPHAGPRCISGSSGILFTSKLSPDVFYFLGSNTRTPVRIAKCCFDRITLGESRQCAGIRDGKMPTQFSKAACNSTDCKYPGITSISVLFGGCGPPTIGKFVIPVVIDSLQSFPGLWMPHVGKEVLELQPSFAHLYSSSTVTEIGLTVFVSAPINHSVPDRVNTGMGKIMGRISKCHSRSSAFPTLDDPLVVQAVVRSNGFCSAITTAPIMGLSPFSGCVPRHQKLAEPASNQRRSFLWHNNECTLLCFRGGPWSRFQGPLLSKYETGGAIYQG